MAVLFTFLIILFSQLSSFSQFDDADLLADILMQLRTVVNSVSSALSFRRSTC